MHKSALGGGDRGQPRQSGAYPATPGVESGRMPPKNDRGQLRQSVAFPVPPGEAPGRMPPKGDRGQNIASGAP